MSRHAEMRIKERMGINAKREIENVVKKAYRDGICIQKDYIPGDTLKWIDYKVNKAYCGRAKNWRIYKGKLFLFSRDLTLVSVLDIPSQLIPQKRLERNR